MRHIVMGILAVLALIAACSPAKHRQVDEWGEDKTMRPEITGNNAKDEARWRQELASDPWGDDAHLMMDEPPAGAPDAFDDVDDTPPKDFVGPPEPPSSWDNMSRGSTKFGKLFFSVMTVLVTLGMMAAPYLLMI